MNTLLPIRRTNIRPVKLLIRRPRWAPGILIRQFEDALLTLIVIGILLVAPASGVAEPICWIAAIEGCE
jgi:hypothetical protein